MQTPMNSGMERRGEYRIGPGASSLLMIFVALCMTTVGVLTLISALADTRLTERSQDQVTAYYDASVEAQRSIGAIDASLQAFRLASPDVDSYRDAVLSLSQEAPDLSVQTDGEGKVASVHFDQPMAGDFAIHVILRVPIALEGPRYELFSHEMAKTSVWQPDETLDVFQDPDAPMGLAAMGLSDDMELEGDAETEGDTEIVEYTDEEAESTDSTEEADASESSEEVEFE